MGRTVLEKTGWLGDLAVLQGWAGNDRLEDDRPTSCGHWAFFFRGGCCLAAVSKRAQGASSAHVLGPAIRQHMHQSVGSKRNID